MTPKDEPDEEEKIFPTLEEICNNTRAIRSDVNKILDHLQEYEDKHSNHDSNGMTWEDLYKDDSSYD